MASKPRTPSLSCPVFTETLSGVLGPPRLVGADMDWDSPAGVITATVHRLDAVGADGRHVDGALRVVQSLQLSSRHLAAAVVARHRSEPGMGIARFVHGALNRVEVISRVTFYRDEREFRDELEVTLAIAALANLVFSLDCGVGQPIQPLPFHDEPSRWGASDFLYLCIRMSQRGEDAGVYGRKLLAKLCRPDDWLPACGDNGDPQIFIGAEGTHSSLGNGLATEVGLRMDLPKADAVKLLDGLLLAEADSIIGPPLLGSWDLTHGGTRLSYRGFWPNLAYIPGFVDNIASWQARRLELARDALAGVSAPSEMLDA